MKSKIFILMFCMILLVGNVSAIDWDNSLRYEENDMKVTIENFWGLPFFGSDIGSLELKSHKFVDEKLELAIGEKIILSYEFTNWELYEDGLGEVILTDLKTEKIIEREYSFVYWEENNYFVDDFDCNNQTSNDCEKVEIENGTWLDYNSKDIPEKDIKIGVKMYVHKGDWIDVVLEVAGEKLERHAEFVQVTETYIPVDKTGNNNNFNMTMNSLELGFIDDIMFGAGDSGTSTTNFQITIYQDGIPLAQMSVEQQPSVFTFNFSKEDYSTPIQIGEFIIGLERLSGTRSARVSTGNNFAGELFEMTNQLVVTNEGINPREINYTNLEIAPTVTLVSPIDFFNTSNPSITFNGTISGLVPDNVTLFINDIGVETNSTGILDHYQFTQIIAEGTHTWNYQACSDVGCSNGTARTITIDTIKPLINITDPVGQIESHSIGNSLLLNWTINDTNLDACWFDYNSINTTVTCNDNTTTFNSVAGQQNLTLYANDTSSNENFQFTSWTYAFLETGVDFNESTFETDSQNFKLNLTTDIEILSISAILTYNGTNFSSTVSCTSGNCTISNTIDIPLVTGGETENKTFFWNLAIFDGIDSSSITTSTRLQNVTRIHLESCNATFPTQSLNFTAHDEQTLDRINPFSFDGFFEFWTGGGSVVRNNSIAINATNVTVCLSPNVTIKTDAIIDYDASTLTTYTNRFYYFDDKEINNISQDIFMYLLESASSTSFILKVQDESLLPVTSAIIEIHRWYPGEGIFRLVQIAKTDSNGKSIGFFETETVDYKFIIKKDGVILFETPDDERQKVVPEVSPFTLTFNTGDPLGEPWKGHEDISNLNSTLVWDDTSGFVTYVYIDNSGDLTLARLLVIKESLVNSTNDTIICNETSELFSATLSCNVGNNSGFYVASSFINRGFGEGLDKQFTFQIQTLSSVVGLLGLFYGWFLVLIASFMFKFNEIAGIWAVTITVFLINLTGLINFGGVFVTGIISVALILTWLMER